MSNHRTNVKWAFWALLGGALAIGLSPIFVRLSEIGPISTAFYRVTLALPVLWFVQSQGPVEHQQQKTQWTRRLHWLIVLCGFFFAADLAFWHVALNYTLIANATLLANTASIFVTLGAWLILRERVSKGFAFGLAVALTGITLLMGQSYSLSTDHLFGDILAIGAALFYAAYLLTVRELRKHLSVSAIMIWSSIGCAVFLLPAAAISTDELVPSTLYGLSILVALAVVSHAGGQGLITYALGHLSAALSSLALLLQPVFAAVFAWWLFNESLVATQILGGLIVLSGVYLCKHFNVTSAD
ncbi:MAG: DMT family transporter [Gammaproteobacteria bacterium]|nr:DMT family transporter [Gammaproteobacteria bacterium]